MSQSPHPWIFFRWQRNRAASPNWSRDGSALYYNGGGRIYRLALEGEPKPELIDTGTNIKCNNDHGISPDGKLLVISYRVEREVREKASGNFLAEQRTVRHAGRHGALSLPFPHRRFFCMKFRSNNCVSLHLPDLRKAEAFYSGILGFRLLAKSASQLEYDTGRFLLYINKGANARPPIPSLTVINAAAAKAHLETNGCEVIEDRDGGLYFKDPFGMVYDVIED